MELNQYFTIDATFAQIIQRIEEYGRANPPFRRKVIRFVVEDAQPIWDGYERTHHFATAYCFSRWEPEEPLFTVSAVETAGVCRVHPELLGDRAKDWFRDMVEWLAPDWTTHDAQPLPQVPFPGAHPGAAESGNTKPTLPLKGRVATSSGTEGGAAPKSNRGRPSFPDEYKKKQVEEYWKVRGHDSQEEFCRRKPFAKRTLGSWISWYRSKWGEPG
ncbi:MAG: hypothetical protein MUC34_20485 [Anaerolineae bacterium]|nr:hypothetical protein [Anaerolineae bacterium]